MSAPSMEKASSSSATNKTHSKTRMNKSSSYSKLHGNESKSIEDESDDEIPITSMTKSKSVSYSPESNGIPQPSMTKSKSSSYSREKKNKLKKVKSAKFNSNLHVKKSSKKRRRGRNKAQTNKFLINVNVGNTVKLTKSRIGFVRYKGKVKFGIGIWYGLECYDSLTKTRHNGTVFGKRYYNCPRNKGLFVKRDIITEIIPAQKIKKVLKELENKQIKEKKLRDKKKKKQEKKNIKSIEINHNKFNNHKTSILALYQQEFYGNNKLMVKLENEQKKNDDEEKIKKDFKRFQRLSFMATKNHDIISIIQKDNHSEMKTDEKKDENEEDPHKGIDIDTEAWDSVKERPICELLDDVNHDNDLDLCGIRLFYDLKLYFTEWEYIFNKGLLIKSIDTDSTQGRALILECGIQGCDGWYITTINDENIKKYSKEAVESLMEKLLPDIGYDIIIKKLE